jgi:hypothetical protein
MEAARKQRHIRRQSGRLKKPRRWSPGGSARQMKWITSGWPTILPPQVSKRRFHSTDVRTHESLDCDLSPSFSKSSVKQTKLPYLNL